MTEVVVAVGIGALLVAAVSLLVGTGFNRSREQFEQVLTTEDARVQLERMSDTLRAAQNNSDDDWLILAEGHQIQIHANIDDDVEVEKVRYVLEETNLKRAVEQPGESENAQIVARSIRNVEQNQALFVYYDANGSPLDSASANANTVRQIEFTLLVDANEQQEPGIATVRTRITPRVVWDSPNENARLWPVIIQFDENDPPTSNLATVTIEDPTTGTQVSQEQVSIEDLNDGRVRTYEGNEYVNLNFQTGSVGSFLENWYSWIGPIFVGEKDLQAYFTNDQISIDDLRASSCIGNTLNNLLANCTERTVENSESGFSKTFRPILTYFSDTNEDYIKDITYGPPPTPPPTPTLTPTPPPKCGANLLAYWKADEGTSFASDVTGGSLSNSPVYPSQWSANTPPLNFPDPYSLRFNGANGETLDLTPDVLNTSNGSYAVWLRIDPAATAGAWVIGSFGKSTISSSQHLSGMILKAYPGQVVFSFGTEGGYVNNTGYVQDTSAATNTWIHYTATWNTINSSSKEIKLYKNGNLVSSYTGPMSILPNMQYKSATYANGQSRTSYTSQYYYRGNIDDLRVYTKALSQSEVQELASGNGECSG